MARARTPSFITEVPLVVTSRDDAELLSHFQAGCQLYNALLNESMVRMELVRQSEAFQKAKKLPKGKARTTAFAEARAAYRFSEYDLHADAAHAAKQSSWIADKIDASTQQSM